MLIFVRLKLCMHFETDTICSVSLHVTCTWLLHMFYLKKQRKACVCQEQKKSCSHYLSLCFSLCLSFAVSHFNCWSCSDIMTIIRRTRNDNPIQTQANHQYIYDTKQITDSCISNISSLFVILSHVPRLCRSPTILSHPLTWYTFFSLSSYWY